MEEDFCDTIYSETLETELVIAITHLEHDPEEGQFWEYEFEALDEDGKDRILELSNEDFAEIDGLIMKFLRSL